MALAVVVMAGCGGGNRGEDQPPFVTLTELFASEDSPADNLDSLAFWPAGPWLLAADFAVVIERDNHSVQVPRQPGLEPVGFGGRPGAALTLGPRRPCQGGRCLRGLRHRQ